MPNMELLRRAKSFRISTNRSHEYTWNDADNAIDANNRKDDTITNKLSTSSSLTSTQKQRLSGANNGSIKKSAVAKKDFKFEVIEVAADPNRPRWFEWPRKRDRKKKEKSNSFRRKSNKTSPTEVDVTQPINESTDTTSATVTAAAIAKTASFRKSIKKSSTTFKILSIHHISTTTNNDDHHHHSSQNSEPNSTSLSDTIDGIYPNVTLNALQ